MRSTVHVCQQPVQKYLTHLNRFQQAFKQILYQLLNKIQGFIWKYSQGDGGQNWISKFMNNWD